VLLGLGCQRGRNATRVDPVTRTDVVQFTRGPLRLRITALRDDLVHFQLTSSFSRAVPASPMVVFQGPPIAWAKRDDTHLATRELAIDVDVATLCVTVTDLARAFVLHRLCPVAANEVTISREATQNVYGLGEQFVKPGTTDGDWLGRERTPGNEHGNAMVKFDGNEKGSGSVGNAQFPIMYALANDRRGYAMFFDDPYAERWSFAGDPWKLHTLGDALQWYVIAGPDLQDLRRDYMTLVGRPPVPPKQAFGLWVSEYGFDDWKELDTKLASLRAHHFPVDGFVLDLQWFGNITEGSETSRMGTLSWDTEKFPAPATKLAELRDKQGVGVMVIEESYVARGLPEHADLARRGFLARASEGGPPVFIEQNPWWGKGGIIDWSNRAGADYWHDLKRKPLVDVGVIGHWCDLGEPELYVPTSWYASGANGGHRHIDIHNLFSLFWVDSIVRGYQRHTVMRRPFMMARSGAPGIERYGASMWSGDIGTNLTTLAAHINVQMNMALSGIDYFGADIGGFHREPLRGDFNETFTQWFADGMAVDVPGRVHTLNLDNKHEVAPDRVGHMPSNLANVRRRYELVPYVYSLAHRAAADGDPVFPPLVWGFQDDPAARVLGGEKLIGESLLVALVAKDKARAIDVYLPRGTTWTELDGDRRFDGGQWLRNVALYDKAGVLRLPMFARAGAIVPLAFVDDKTLNVLGKRADGTRHDELRVRVFAGGSSQFTLYEDDGETIRYQRGEVRRTKIAQHTDARVITVTIAAVDGTYANAPSRRAAVVDVVVAPGTRVGGVTLDGAEVPQKPCDVAPGWCVLRNHHVRVSTTEADVATPRTINVAW